MNKAFALWTFVTAAAAIGLLATGLGTEEWTIIKITRDANAECVIQRSLGMFNGKDVPSDKCFAITEEVSHQMFNKSEIAYNSGAQMASLVFILFGILGGLFAMAISAYNIVSKPYETFAGPIGMISYFTSGLVFTLIGIIIYVVLFYNDFKDSVPEKCPSIDSICHEQGYKTESAELGYSFYLIVAAIGPFLIGIIIVFAAGNSLKKKIRSVVCPKKFEEEPHSAGEKDVNMMSF
uniref:Clarin-3-like n=1 Tax=Ciona intestinalis TaxID=7719 RepID=H2XWB7_CIOIN|nr:clarin-3-like [Ciona intestinalis]|eukprot:XP_002130009.1 clarin-3-like [Ciona intestinalis]